MIATNRDYTTATSTDLIFVFGVAEQLVELAIPDGGWWENLLAFMWRLFVRLMPQDGAKRKPPLVAKPESMKRLADTMPGAVHGPIHYWSGHV